LVKITIYDALGREIETLVNGNLQPGIYEIEWDGSSYSNGVYYYHIVIQQDKFTSGDYVKTMKMVLLK